MKNLNYYFLSALAIFFVSLTYMTHQQREEVITNQDSCDEELMETAVVENTMSLSLATMIQGTEMPQNQDVEQPEDKKNETSKSAFVAAKHVPSNPFKEKKYKDTVAVISGKILGKSE